MNFTLMIQIDKYFYDKRVDNHLLDFRQPPVKLRIPDLNADNKTLSEHLVTALGQQLRRRIITVHRIHYSFIHPWLGYQVLNDDLLNLTLSGFLQDRHIDNPPNELSFQLYVSYN